MNKILLIVLSLFSITASAVSMENNIFSLDAKSINFKPGTIKAKEHVFLRIKSLDDLSKFVGKSNVALSELTQQRGILNLALSDGWIIKGKVLAVSINGNTAIIESDELHLVREQLIVQNL